MDSTRGVILRMLLRNCINRIDGEAVSLLTKAAPGFNGRVTLYIESSLPRIFIKVTCGVARRLPAATMRLIYKTTTLSPLSPFTTA